MNRVEIKKILPHREPMLLVDEVVGDENCTTCRGKYTIKHDEFFCRGHFPDNPIVPGVIQCEIMAQCCVMFLQKENMGGKLTLYAGLDKVRFKKTIKPGDVCEITASLKERKGSLFFCSAKIEVRGELCCKGELTFAVTNA